jgi:ABC-2 type transport system permease protein
VLRALRDPRYLILAIGAPIGFYLLFTSLFGKSPGANGLPTQVALMVSMGVFGAMWAVLSATGPRIAQERSIGWLRQVQLLPVRPQAILVARLLAAMVLAGPALALVFLTAVLTNGVTLDTRQWVELFALLWVGVTPIALLGIAIGYATGADAAFGLLFGLYQVLAALGGLWMPMSILPDGLQTVGKVLPSYRAADMGWRLIGGQAFDPLSVMFLVAWAAIFALLAISFARRAARSR